MTTCLDRRRTAAPSAEPKALGLSFAAPTPPSPPALAASPNALTLLRALKRCWRKAVAVAAVGAVVLAGLTYAVVPSSKYTAQALLKVDPAQKWMFNTGEPPIPFATYMQNQVTLARSRHVLQS